MIPEDPSGVPEPWEGFAHSLTGNDLWTTADIAHRLGISAERARLVCTRADFPEPVQSAPYFDLWQTSEVELWLREGQPDGFPPADLPVDEEG